MEPIQVTALTFLLLMASPSATKTDVPPQIDGIGDDAVWANVQPVREFTQQLPNEGAPPSHGTEVRLLYDARYLYVLFRLADDGEVVQRLTRRDRDVASDSVSLDLDTTGAGKFAYHFDLSAAGVQRDAIRTGDDALNFDWDAVWSAAARTDDRGWTGELAVPWSSLRFQAGAEGGFRVQVRRFIARLNETDALVFVPRSSRGELLRYAKLEGVAGLNTPRGLMVAPFILGKVTHSPAPGEPDEVAYQPSAGLDARIGLTPALALDATVLPDFGQVEADTALLNLTTFEIDLPEKRPFFLEGADLFALRDVTGERTSTQLFYSRRIGAPAPGVELPVGVVGGARPDRIRVLGAAKVTGRVSETASLALVDGLTAREDVGLDDGSRAVVAPPANFVVGRAQVELPRGFTLGLSAGDVHRAEQPESMVLSGTCTTGTAPAADGRCTHDATTASVDGAWQSDEGEYSATAALMVSRLAGGPERRLPDGVTLGAGDTGVGARFEAAKFAGQLVIDAVYETYSPKLDLNDVGFLRSQNLHRVLTQVGWRVFDRGVITQSRTAVELFGRQSWDGAAIARGLQLNNSTRWSNFWSTWLELQAFPTTYDNRETRDGARTEQTGQLGVEWEVETNPSRPVVFEVEGNAHNTWRGFQLDAVAEASFRPADRLELSLGPAFSRVTGDPRWVDTVDAALSGRDYLYGLQNAAAVGVTLRSTLTFTPRMTLQAYAQLFSASVKYDALYSVRVEGERPVLRLSELAPLDADLAQYSEHETVLNASVVFRYEYLPGSVIYLVYNRAQNALPEAVENTRMLDFSSLGHATTENVVMAKLSYYFAR